MQVVGHCCYGYPLLSPKQSGAFRPGVWGIGTRELAEPEVHSDHFRPFSESETDCAK